MCQDRRRAGPALGPAPDRAAALAGGGSKPATGGDGGGTNAQTGEKSGTETERDAPGMSTDKKADDTK